MNISRNFTISQENVERLAKVGNKSGLINELLDKHFNKPKDKSLELLDNEIKELENKRKESERLIKIEKNKESLDINDRLKTWLINLKEKPSALSIFTYLKALGLTNTYTREQVIEFYERLHN